MRQLRSFVLVLFMAASALAQSAAGSWSGAIELPGTPLQVSVDLAESAGGWTGTISIPQQGAKDLPLQNVTIDGSEVSFAIAGIPGNPTFNGTISADGGEIKGDFTQGGGSFPFHLTSAAAASAEAAGALEDFSQVVASALERFEVPGTGIAVVKDDEVIYAEGFGLRNVADQLPVTADTLFPIGSSTKAFTTFALGTLVDEGRLDWDRPVRDYLPDFVLANDYLTTHLTPRDLVTHRSGYPRHDLVWYNNQDLTRRELVDRLEHLEPSAELRQKFQYNNLMYLTAGYLLEQMTGLSWEDALRARVLEPLGMTRSTFADAESVKDADHALPYDKRDDEIRKIPFREVGNMGPAGSINSSVNEMANWLKVQLDAGRFEGQTLVQPSTLREMHTPQMHMAALPPDPEVGPSSYGLGWFIDTYRGHLRVHHGGNIDGFSALVTLYPHEDLGIVVLTNRNGTPLPGLLTRHLADRLLGLEHEDWLSEAHAELKQAEAMGKEAEKKKESVRVTGTRPSHPVGDYAGRYHHDGYGELLIEKKGQDLSARYNSLTAPLQHWHYDVFNGGRNDDDPVLEDLKFAFEGDLNGNISAVSVPLDPFVDPIRFRKLPPEWMSDPTELEKLTGEYQLGPQAITISLQGDRLVTSIPGQPTFELEPDLDGWFNLAELTGFRVRFDGDKLEISQPNGVFTATRK